MDGTCPLTDLDGAVALLLEMLATLEAKSRQFYVNRYGTSPGTPRMTPPRAGNWSGTAGGSAGTRAA